jgi:peroxiredoxin
MTIPAHETVPAPLPGESLTARLADYDRELLVRDPEWSQAYDDLVRRLQDAHSGSWSPSAGEPFPYFMLPDENGHLVAFDDLIASGPLVISFNRGHWCNYCRLELSALQAIAPYIRGCGASIVSITPELPAFWQPSKEESGITYPLLCDLDLSVSLSLGLAIPIGERIAALLTGDGTVLSQLNGGIGWLLPIPATFIVARDGTIAACQVDPDFRRRLDPAKIVAALRML